MHTIRLGALLLCLVLLGACAGVDPGPAAQRVQEDVARRSGHAITWKRDADSAALGAAASTAEALRQEEAPASGDPEAPPALSLEQAVSLALQHNQDLQARFEELGVAQGQLAQATLAAAPTFSGDRMYLHGASPGWALSLAVDLAGLLLLPLRQGLGEAEVTRVELAATAAILDCIQQVRENWYALAAANQALAIALDELLAVEAAYEMSQRMREAGNISELELLVRRARYETVKLSIAKAETALLEAREGLNARMGLWGGAVIWEMPRELPPLPSEELPLDDVEARAVQVSLDLALARQEVVLGARELGLAEWATLLPSLSIGLDTKREPGDKDWQLGPSWSVPAFFLSSAQGSKAAGNAALRRDWRRYQAIAVNVRATARAARARLLFARQALDYHDQVVVPLHRNITTQTQLQYNAMQLGVFDLLDAKRQELEQRRARVQAGLEYWLARGRMEHLLAGRMTTGHSPQDGIQP